MENLPAFILVDILSRLNSADLACCRLVCRNMRFLSGEVHSISVFCSRERFFYSRDVETRELIIPFRSMLINLISFLSGSGALRSVSVSVEEPNALAEGYDDDDDTGFYDTDNLHLTDVDVLSQWLPSIASSLTSLSIGDYWNHSHWTPSTVLRLISENCSNLLNLEIKSAWLSVEGLKPMLTLINLKLEFITLVGEDLTKLNECFPNLQVLKLNVVRGLMKPKINLLQLRVCHWTVSFPLYLAIHAPKLVELKLECYEPDYLVLETPLLTQFDLKINKPGGHVKVQSFICLKFVRVETSSLKGIKQLFGRCQTVRKLELEEFSSIEIESLGKIDTIADIISTFPNVDDLMLGPGAWSRLCRDSYISREWRNLKRLTIKLPLDTHDDIALLSHVLNFCIPSCEVAVYINDRLPDITKEEIITRCTSHFPMYKWNWGTWKEKSGDTFFDAVWPNF